MGVLSQSAAMLLLTLAALAAAADNTTKAETTTKDDNSIYDGYDDDYDLPQDTEEIMFNEDKPCPRDCVCEKSQGYKIAKCNRLELGTQKFGDDISDLIVEHLDPSQELNLEDEIFKKLGLHQITSIKIVNTTITSVSPTAFRGLQDLYAVTLTGNNLRNLHPETFANNKKLILLTLSDNPLKFPAKGSKDYFLNSSTVQELDISNCKMRYIATETFTKIRTLMYLNVANNELSSLDNDVFRSLPDLEELDLSDNYLIDLGTDLFSGNTELATLHIQRNAIETVYGLEIPDIVTLNAGETKIKFVGPSMFNGLTYIANLNLSGNGIEKIHNQAFHKLQDLNYLDLSHNDLDLVSSLLIEQNTELDIFKISNNPRLKQLPKNGFNCSADQFNIYLFDAASCGLEEISDGALSMFPALTQINLSGNKLKSIGDKVFQNCTRLVEVNLANNLLTTLSTTVFAQNKEISKLNLRGNPIKVLSAEVFVFTPKLTWLDLSQTDLSSLWLQKSNHSIKVLSDLLYLNISNANIRDLKPYEIESLNKLNTLDISNNPLVCGREFELLMNWVTKYMISSAAKEPLVANMARDDKGAAVKDDPYSWDSLVKRTCDTNNSTKYFTTTSTSAPASDEEIWEKIEDTEIQDPKYNLNNVAEDAAEVPVAADNDALLDDDNLDGGDDEADDDDDDADDDDYDDDININIKLIDEEKPLKVYTTEGAKEFPELKKEFNELEMEVKVLDIAETVEALGRSEHGRYDYIWPLLIGLLATLMVLLLIGKVMMVVCSRRSRQSRYNSAIIAAMSQSAGRTKKDCGAVYQQLSEDLVGPRTPKLSRYAPLPAPAAVHASHISYEGTPFHNNNVVPEAV